MNYAIDVAWEHSNRGFWTRRKKSATSLIAVICLIAGVAVAFKLFDSTVPNNVVRDATDFDYEVWKFEESIGDADFENTAGATPIYEGTDSQGNPVETFPGQTRDVEVKILNTNIDPALDATFFVFVDPDSFVVTGCFASDGSPIALDENGNCGPGATTTTPTTVPQTGVTANAWLRFTGFWTLTIDKEKVLGTPAGEANEDDHTGQNLVNQNGDPDDSGNRQYTEACFDEIRVINRANACNLGNVRGAGTRDLAGEQLDARYYVFGLTEHDDGGDQSPFKGWSVQFDLVFQARVPAIPEAAPVYER